MESQLPSEADFWNHHVEALETCNICLEPFNSTHLAIRFIGKDACPHIFGGQCLREWSETASQNANKCPVCRRVLWKAEDGNNEPNPFDELGFDVAEFLEELEQYTHEELVYLLGDPEQVDVEANSISDGYPDHGHVSDATNDGDDDSISLSSFSSLMVETPDGVQAGGTSDDSISLLSFSLFRFPSSDEPHITEEHTRDDSISHRLFSRDEQRTRAEQTAHQLLESWRSLDTSIEDTFAIDWDEGLDTNEEQTPSERPELPQVDDDSGIPSASQPATSTLGLDEDTNDEFYEDTTETLHIQTISLSDCDRATIAELVDNLFLVTESSALMPHDANTAHIRERMEHCIDRVLEDAGYRQPFLVAPGTIEGMLRQFEGMVVYRRDYGVSETYMRWWKDVMLSFISGKGTRPFRSRV